MPNRSRVSKVVIRPTNPSTFAAHRAEFLKQPPLADPTTSPASSGTAASSAAKVGVNAEFYRQLRAIFRILVPRKRSKEAALIVAHSAFLLLRTYLSLLVAKLDGKLVGDLVSRDADGFVQVWVDKLTRVAYRSRLTEGGSSTA